MQNAFPRVLPAAAFVGMFLAWTLPCDLASAAKPRDFGSVTTASRLHTASPAAAQTNISNSVICTAPNDQIAPFGIADGSGNSIIFWSDYRSSNFDVYAQKVNSSGQSLWFMDGSPICKDLAEQVSVSAVSDGQGGAIFVWQDWRNGTDKDIYAQRIDSFGTPLWTGNGVVVCNATGDQLAPVAVADGIGGVIVGWTDSRAGANASDVYAQRLNGAGVVQWTANGVALCTAAGVQRSLAIATDGNQGAYIAWQDHRLNQFIADIYAIRVTSAGVPQGTANGTALCTATNSQESPVAVADGGGGVIVGWEDHRGLYWSVYAQRFTSTVQWTPDGVPVSANAQDKTSCRVTSDGAAGAVFVWQDARNGLNADVYAQRVSPAGAPVWAVDGVAVSAATGDQSTPEIQRDPTGGSLIAWSDSRSATSGADMYAQKINGSGVAQWTVNGVQLCDAPNAQDSPAIVPDGVGGALVAWRDGRGLNTDIYGQPIDGTGTIGNQCVTPDSLAESVPQTLTATQNYKTFYSQVGGFPIYYWVGIGVRSAPGSDWDIEAYDSGSWNQAAYPGCFGASLAGSFGTGVVDFVMYDENENHTPPGIYGIRPFRYSGSGNGTVEFDGNTDTITLSSASDPNHPVSSPANWTGVLDVYDVGLTAGITYTFDLQKSPSNADIRLHFFSSVNSPDYYYVVPRSSQVFEQTGRYFQYQAPATAYYGVVLTNETGVAAQYTVKVWSDTPTTGVGGGPVGFTTGIESLSPNPAHGRAAIKFSLREAGDVSFDVLDMAGRVVSRIPSRHWQPGVWSIDWDGRSSGASSLSTGIYFVQMQVNGRRVGIGRVALIQ